MSNAEEEKLHGWSSAERVASGEGGHHRWSQGVVTSFFAQKRVDKVEVPQMQDVCVARQAKMGRSWSESSSSGDGEDKVLA